MSIIVTMKSRCQPSMGDKFTVDIVRQWKIATSLCRRFIGREQLLDSIINYIRDKTDRPVIIHGLPGDGMTSLISAAACHTRTSLTSSSNHSVNLTVVIRLCTPADSSTSIIDGLLEQLQSVTSCPKILNCTDNSQALIDLLNRGNISRLVIIYLNNNYIRIIIYWGSKIKKEVCAYIL